MSPLVILLAATAIGVEAGWQPLAEGGHQYTIQIEPSLLSVLNDGNDLVSEVPEHIHVRRLRITVGTGELARVDGDAPSTPPESATPQAAQPHQAPQVAKPDGPAMPARFDDAGSAAQLLAAPGKASDAAAAHSTEKPRLDASAGGATSRPWGPLVVAAALLACSLAANVFLGWIYVEARRRYRDAVSRLRTSPAS
jgi:hypothetical protein